MQRFVSVLLDAVPPGLLDSGLVGRCVGSYAQLAKLNCRAYCDDADRPPSAALGPFEAPCVVAHEVGSQEATVRAVKAVVTEMSLVLVSTRQHNRVEAGPTLVNNTIPVAPCLTYKSHA
jgi:hypothetical protein